MLFNVVSSLSDIPVFKLSLQIEMWCSLVYYVNTTCYTNIVQCINDTTILVHHVPMIMGFRNPLIFLLVRPWCVDTVKFNLIYLIYSIYLYTMEPLLSGRLSSGPPSTGQPFCKEQPIYYVIMTSLSFCLW